MPELPLPHTYSLPLRSDDIQSQGPMSATAPAKAKAMIRFNVVGVDVHALNLEGAVDLLVDAAAGRRPGGYVCFCDVNNVMSARRLPEYRRILANAWLLMPDGMPIVWMGKRAYGRRVNRVYGPDVLELVCARTAGTPLRHFFCGGLPGVAEQLSRRLQARFAGLRVCGSWTPPQGPLDTEQEQALVATVRAARPDFLWVGMSTPWQDRFIARYHRELGAPVSLAVGAAFDFLSGRKPQAPRWMRRCGLEWFFRLCIEPKRLAPRYLRNNPQFLLLALAQTLGVRPVGRLR